MTGAIEIAELDAEALAARAGELGALLHACVHAGASISFVLPFAPAEAEAFWRDKVLPGVRSGRTALLVVCDGGRIVGTVQLDCDTPPNQPHRAEVRKLMVHPEARRRGTARALMAAVERIAAGRSRSLITLDTRAGDGAEPLYASIGYRTVGRIPGYSVDPHRPSRLDPVTIMYKPL